jgi:Arc/MetJ family transcription regulator
MAKRPVEVDEELLRAAQSALGTSSDEDTLQLALLWAVRRRQVPLRDTPGVLAAFAAASEDLSDPEVMKAAWS